jgi:hypothetical protein
MDEWSSLVKTAVVVLIILLAISVVLTIAYFSLNAANKGAEKIANTTTAMDQRSFDPYNQRTISGVTVLAGIKNFQNHPVAVLIRTRRDGTNVRNYAAFLGEDGVATAPGNDAAWYHDFTLEAINGSEIPEVEGLVSDLLLYSQWQNLNLKQADNKSAKSYINPSAKFYSVLVYDTNDEIIGVYMEQVGVTGGVLQS